MINIYIINLQKRTDRWDMIIDEINKKSNILCPVRSLAYEGDPGWLYCGLSHLRLIKFAKNMNLPYILVGEDDFQIICNNFDERLTDIINYLDNDPEWDIFNANPSYLSYHDDINIRLINNNPNIVRCDKGSTANFIIYRNTIYDKMLELHKHYDKLIQNWAGNIYISKNSINHHAFDSQLQIHNFNIITSYPYLTTQRDNYSDIEKTSTRYQEGIRIHGEHFIYQMIKDNLKKKIIKIIDSNFVGDKCVTKYQQAKHIVWRRVSPDYLHYNKKDIIFFTDNHIDINIRNDNIIKIAWLLEPQAINPLIYDKIKTRENYFDIILTHNYELAQRSSKYIWYPFGGTWIKQKDTRIYNKTKLISTIASNKLLTDGHKLRHIVISKYAKLYNIDTYGRAYRYITDKLDCLKDYCFQIVIENSVSDTYFTEKIIDCFATGTIPIYRGTKNITKFFNGNGIILFDDYNELPGILESLSFDKYNSMINYVSENFKLVDTFRTAEDWLYINYPYLFDYKLYYNYIKMNNTYNRIFKLYKNRKYSELLLYADYYLSDNTSETKIDKKHNVLFLKAHSLQELGLYKEAKSAYMEIITDPNTNDKLKNISCTNIQLLK